MTIIETLINYIFTEGLSQKHLLIALSGGVDSIVLLDALYQVHPKELITALHCDHGWHPKSISVAKELEQYVNSLGIDYSCQTLELNSVTKNEENARNARYEAIASIAEQKNIDNVLLAHNFDDHIETIIFRLIRGTDTIGLRGIPISRVFTLDSKRFLHRPLLNISKQEIETYACEQNLPVWQDPSNKDISYRRNYIRHEVFPLLNNLNPRFKQSIEHLAEFITDDTDLLDDLVDKSYPQFKSLPLDLADFQIAPRAIQRRILKRHFIANSEFLIDFMQAIKDGGFQKINFQKNKFFVIKKKQIHLEIIGE